MTIEPSAGLNNVALGTTGMCTLARDSSGGRLLKKRGGTGRARSQVLAIHLLALLRRLRSPLAKHRAMHVVLGEIQAQHPAAVDAHARRAQKFGELK